MNPEQIPILTTLYLADDPSHWRYADLDQWVKHCFDTSVRKRLVCLESAPLNFRQWLIGEGHRIIVEGVSCGPKRPRMAAMLGKAVTLLAAERNPPTFVWTIELDACVPRETLEIAERRFMRSPPKIAALELRATNVQGQTVFPSRGKFAMNRLQGNPNAPLAIPFACWSAALWRLAALKEIDFSLVPPLNQSDIQAGRQLGKKGWRFVGIANLTYAHKMHGSYSPSANWTQDPSTEIPEKPLKLNLGCGAFYKEGYVNVDVRSGLDKIERKEIKTDTIADVTCGLDQFKGRCDEIYAGHVLEHLDNPAAALSYWFGLLIPKIGKILVVIPDTAKAVAANSWSQTRQHVGAYLTDSEKAPGPCDHLQIYWLGRLRADMQKAGFVDIQEVNVGLDERIPSKSGFQSALEARRP